MNALSAAEINSQIWATLAYIPKFNLTTEHIKEILKDVTLNCQDAESLFKFSLVKIIPSLFEKQPWFNKVNPFEKWARDRGILSPEIEYVKKEIKQGKQLAEN